MAGDKVVLEQPRLPAGIESMKVAGIAVGAARIELNFRRRGKRILAFAKRLGGDRSTHIAVRL